MDTVQFWDMAKMLIVAVVAAMMAKMDRDHRDFQRQNTELFKDLFSRVRKIELTCATNHGMTHRKLDGADES